MNTPIKAPRKGQETLGYRRDLSFWTVVFLATGGILGPAVGFTPVSVLALSGPSGLLSWVVAFLLIMPVAMAYVELGTMWPKAGGVAYYPINAGATHYVSPNEHKSPHPLAGARMVNAQCGRG